MKLNNLLALKIKTIQKIYKLIYKLIIIYNIFSLEMLNNQKFIQYAGTLLLVIKKQKIIIWN